MPKALSYSQIASNIFGTLGYTSGLLQWLWIGALLLPTLLDSNLKDFLIPTQTTESAPHFSISADGVVWTILASVITIIMLGLTVLVMVRLPSAIANTGKKATQSSAAVILPVVIHHKPVPAKRKSFLTAAIVGILKLLYAVVPATMLISVFFIKSELSVEIALFIGFALAIITLAMFGVQYLIARLAKIPFEQII